MAHGKIIAVNPTASWIVEKRHSFQRTLSPPSGRFYNNSWIIFPTCILKQALLLRRKAACLNKYYFVVWFVNQYAHIFYMQMPYTAHFQVKWSHFALISVDMMWIN